jgi:hypothetical protein
MKGVGSVAVRFTILAMAIAPFGQALDDARRRRVPPAGWSVPVRYSAFFVGKYRNRVRSVTPAIEATCAARVAS